MPVDPLDKPISKLREETIDQLTLNYSHGEISLEAFERRLDEALDAETHDKLLSLTKDLDLVVDATFMAQKKTPQYLAVGIYRDCKSNVRITLKGAAQGTLL